MLSAAVGALVTAIMLIWRERRDARRGLCVALSELLEIRHMVVRTPAAFQSLVTQAGGRSSEARQMFNLMRPLFANPSAAAAERYDRAVTLISEVDPFLAHRLRSREVVADLERFFAPIAGHEEEAQSQLYELSDFLRPDAEKALDEAIRSLALRIGPITYLRSLRLLRTEIELADFVADLQERARVLGSWETASPERPDHADVN